jgi:hypothetical protein
LVVVVGGGWLVSGDDKPQAISIDEHPWFCFLFLSFWRLDDKGIFGFLLLPATAAAAAPSLLDASS